MMAIASVWDNSEDRTTFENMENRAMCSTVVSCIGRVADPDPVRCK